jgi:16S rRNA C967 or C1407 C5-methylase (RsmB/RsmF family)
MKFLLDMNLPPRWVQEEFAALRDEDEAKRVIDAVPKRHPFEMRYDRIENVDWESCSRVLESASQLEALRKGW